MTSRPRLVTMPPELLEEIIRFLPAGAQANLARVARQLVEPCQEELYRTLDVLDSKVLEGWLCNGHEKRARLLEYTQSLFCRAGPKINETNTGVNVATFLEDHLPKFPNLLRLTVCNGVISPDRFRTPLTFHKLTVLTLKKCSMSFRDLVTLLNQLPELIQLTLHKINIIVDEEKRVTQLHYYPTALSMTESGNGVLRELSDLPIPYKELTLDIFQDGITAPAQKFITYSVGSLVRLDLGNTLLYDAEGCLTLSGCNELCEVTMNAERVTDTISNLISTITSPKLQKIKFRSVIKLRGKRWEHVDNILVNLVRGLKVDITVEIDLSIYLRCLETFFGIFLQNFRNLGGCRVVLMQMCEDLGVVVVHDSRRIS